MTTAVAVAVVPFVLLLFAHADGEETLGSITRRHPGRPGLTHPGYVIDLSLITLRG